MGLGSKDPRMDEKVRTWTVEKLKGGGVFYGWVAGRVLGVIVHTFPPSKPCHDELSDGKLECPHCAKRPQEWSGYLALYNESGQPTVVQIHENHRLQAQALELHQPVKVERKAGTYKIIRVEPNGWAKPYDARGSERARHANLWPWLITTLWKSENLYDFFKDDPAMAMPKIATQPSKAERNAAGVARSEEWVRGVQREMLVQNGHHDAAAKLAGTIDDATGAALGGIMRRAGTAEPSKNGSHRKGEG